MPRLPSGIVWVIRLASWFLVVGGGVRVWADDPVPAAAQTSPVDKSASSDTKSTVPNGDAAQKDDASAKPKSPKDATPTENPAEAEKKKQAALSAARIAAIQKLTFDRSPIAVLTAWKAGDSPDSASDEPAQPDVLTTAEEMIKAGLPAATAQQYAARGMVVRRVNGNLQILSAASAAAASSSVAAPPTSGSTAPSPATVDPEFAKSLRQFAHHVTLGRWDDVRTFWNTLSAKEQTAAHARLLEQLATSGLAQGTSPPQINGQPLPLEMLPTPVVSPVGLAALIDLMPRPTKADTTDEFGKTTPSSEKSSSSGAPDAVDSNTKGSESTSSDTKPMAEPDLLGPRVQSLGRIVRTMQSTGYSRSGVLEVLRSRTRGDDPPLTPVIVARILVAAGESDAAADFIPDIPTADGDPSALQLIAQRQRQLYRSKKIPADLITAWDAAQAMLDSPKSELKDRRTALGLILEMIDDVEEPAASAFLSKVFTAPEEGTSTSATPSDRPSEEPTSPTAPGAGPSGNATEANVSRTDESPSEASAKPAAEPDGAVKSAPPMAVGRELLALLGTQVHRNVVDRASDAAGRQTALERAHRIVGVLTSVAPERASQWSDVLDLLTIAWLREGWVTTRYDRSTDNIGQMNRDRYGNFYYIDPTEMMRMNMMQREPSAIATRDLLPLRPDGAWRERISDALVLKVDELTAQLMIKVGHFDAVLPRVTSLAAVDPKLAHGLAEELLRSWAKRHDLNKSQQQTNPYIFMYGYEERAAGIPLTRSKQERNLEELSGILEKLRALPIEPIDQDLLVAAFTNSHSAAEVYQQDAIERVFGNWEILKPETIATLAEQMRSHLASTWRNLRVQETAKTNRKKQDVEREVLQGYQTARKVLLDAMQSHPDSWQLIRAEAALSHDENDYRNSLASDAAYTPTRRQAIGRMEQAANLYAKAVTELSDEERSNAAYDTWFYASLGAVDLDKIDDKTAMMPGQSERIRQHILDLPGEAANQHMDRFATNLFSRLQSVAPPLKFRYLREGLAIVGDHPLVREAREVFEYYQDLVTEIRLQATLDGSDVVGHDSLFGVYVYLVHTPEIERESGGFAKYLQNQTSMPYAYNYGRPPADYRDRFEDAARAALEGSFDVVSITFEKPDVKSRPAPEAGWRQTPYAYLLLKARGPEVDTLPSLRLDLDFLDTSGFAILPIESSPTPVVARADDPPARPLRNLTIIETLDERQADEGRLILQIRATGHGIIPPIERLIDLPIEGFTVTEVKDDDLVVSKFDEESGQPAVLCERSGLITLTATDGARAAETFRFPEPTEPTTEMTYQRYVDADLLNVEPTISLERQYGRPSVTPWLVGLAVLALSSLGLIGALIVWRRSTRDPDDVVAALPSRITPFWLLGDLRRRLAQGEDDSATRQALADQIREIERRSFGQDELPMSGDELHQIAVRWQDRYHEDALRKNSRKAVDSRPQPSTGES